MIKRESLYGFLSALWRLCEGNMSVIQIVCIVLLVLLLIGSNSVLIFYQIKKKDWLLVPFWIFFLAAGLDAVAVVTIIAGAFGALG